MASLKFLLAISFSLFTFHLVSAAVISHDGRAITIDGKRRVLLSGSIHYPRSTPQMWPDLIKKSKEGGLDAIETYVFWNVHEPSRRQYDFGGNLDLVRFIKAVQDEGLYAVLRIGPYVCAEWNYGGFPVWLHNMPGIELRTANSIFMNEMQNFTSLIVDMMKQEQLFASQGGPIIIAQVENEYGNVMSSYGAAGKAYIDWCANMAESLNIGVPWIMCQQSDAPDPMINTCNGWYCDQFTPSNPNSPKMWTENWTGWFKSWGGKDPHRTAEDVAFAVARFFQTGGTFQNYYMYHGGTNFGRTAGGPYITTSYDYDAPLDEFGNLNQPKWGHLKQLHDVLHSMEEILTSGTVSSVDYDNSVTATIYATDKESSCFLSNANETSDATIEFKGTTYTIPAWSVSILPDCANVGYNTAKVKTQTSVMVKRDNKAEDEPTSLNWSWRPENVDKTVLLGQGHIHAKQIVDQKAVANDASDYLWYMTSVDLKKDDLIWSKDMSIRINGSGHILHAYVNGEYLGSQWSEYSVSNYVFEKSVKLKHGRNLITLLSATVGLANYGANYDLIQAGILGPVELVGRKGDETIIKDLSNNRWSYKVGLLGLEDKLYLSDSKHASKWQEQELPTNKMLTWYKTTFKAPLGTDPVVLDLQGLGKGMAWINGNSIGRYWPSFLAEDDGCSTDLCDYRGPYDNNKCVSNCGKPTQRWYHVPRSFLQDNENTLVLFEEFGGNPSQVNFQTVVTGVACVSGDEGEVVEISCNGQSISAVQFASFGDPQGTCGSSVKGSCEGTEDALLIVQKACVGNESCSLEVSHKLFGSTSCDNGVNRLAVEVLC
ncbi:beta-galactosidase 15 [Ricinus communis]|uniref:Beta-galactosidase n=1 Tax=Ricinus communis TaxID=3988 RepID=B9RR68_RICCO|nr:beta-galactosidase 15 [Ricinus communis]EEF46239.1 beta-galactosidase, putative [Ricinus communis]|eukprot:XP_002516237.1 beta-galactosidase 15 [Ricinus communis]